MLCRVCGKEMLFTEEVNGCVVGHANLKDSVFRMPTCKVTLYRCKNCSHIQAENSISENYYDKYDLYEENQSVYHGDFRNINDNRILELSEIATNNHSILDIGCGRGDTLQIAQSYFKNCTGVEPSAQECRKARDRGLYVIQSYFDNTLKLDQKFSAFISTMVFEHLDNPFETLSCAFNVLETGGVGLINVPNGQLINRNNYYHQITSEHINYYTPLSLSMLAFKSGFDVIRIEEDDDLIELNLYIRKSIKQENMSKAKKIQKEKLADLLYGKQNVLIWGAGTKAHTYSDLLGNLEIKHIIDSSVEKVGKYVSNIKLQIERISEEIINNSDAIIIFATTYNAEIIKELRENYNYLGKIVYFENNDVKCIGSL